MNSKNEKEHRYGQPYYDENGVYHSGFESDDIQGDPNAYEEQYRRQMEQYNQMYGDDFDADVDIEFYPLEERFNTENGCDQTAGAQTSDQGNTPPNRQAYKNTNQKNAPRTNTQRQRQGNSDVRKQNRAVSASHKNNSGSNNKKTGSAQKSKPQNGVRKKASSAKSAPKKNAKPAADYRKNKIKGNGSDMKKKRKKPIKTFFIILISILLLLVIIFNAIIFHYIGKVNKIERGTRTMTSAAIKSDNVRNILVIGSDSRSPKDRGRTDTIIMLSINKETKKITMTSFMRDMYVNVKGRNDDGENIDYWGKINSAYVYGGAELLMDTIEYNFNVEIEDYVYFGFDSFIDIVDAVDGIEITITDEEAQGMQPQTREINDILKRDHDKDILTEGGTYKMNGYQALAYARLRYVGNADFQRTERQREVMNKIIDKVKSSPLSINKFGSTAAESISTNMSNWELYKLFYKCLFSLNYDINDLRLPEEGTYSYGNHDGQSTLDVDFEACQKVIKEKIYS